MFPVRKIAWSLSVAAVAYVLLAMPWPGVRQAYRAFYRGTATMLMTSFGSSGTVQFEAIGKGGTHEHDLKIYFGRGMAQRGSVTIHTGRVGYAPTAMLLALVVGAPVAWKRKLRSLLIGMVLVQVFVFGRLALFIVCWYSTDNPFQLYHPGPFWFNVLERVTNLFFLAPGMSFIVPAVIAGVTTFSIADLHRLSSAPDGAAEQPADKKKSRRRK